MKELLSTDRSLLLRTNFPADQTWRRLCNAVKKPSEEGFIASFDYIDDLSYEGLTIEDLTNAVISGEQQHYFICVADRITLTGTEQPILVVDFYNQPGRTFRVIPSWIWSIENNLSLANMDFQDFADSCDSDGVFRGF